MLPIPDDLDRIAVLLDVDGTLLEIAPTPQAVVVPDSLRSTLEVLHARTNGALALVSGRPIADLDSLFAPLRLPAVGGHGAEMRPLYGGDTVDKLTAPIDPKLRNTLKEIASRHEGVIVEDKGYSIALHYRTAPKQGLGLIHDVKHACGAPCDGQIELLAGKAVLELKPAGFNKGTAVRELMGYGPFAGRKPIFIGDDKTDEHAFAVIPEFDGISASVGRKIPNTNLHFHSPSEVRSWLERLAINEVALS